MADLSDVENALRDLIASTLYPTGSPPSVVGSAVVVYAGWPDPQTLDRDKLAGKSHVSIYPRKGDRNTTRQDTGWREVGRNAATYTLTASGQTVTVGGAAPNPYAPQNLVLIINGQAVAYQATAGRTAAQVAASLAALVAGATVAGAVITLPPTARLTAARVGVQGQAVKVVRNQEKSFQLTIWAPTNDLRIAIAKAIDPVLSDTPRLALADGSIGRLTYQSSEDNDFDQRQGLFRRDLNYTVEFATTRVQTFEEVVVAQLELSRSIDLVTPGETLHLTA